jgi:hypothetical protein
VFGSAEGSGTLFENERDYHLITAAPDLLWALVEAKGFIDDLRGKISKAVYESEELKKPDAFKYIDCHDFDGNAASLYEIINSAIAKARGQ